MDIKTIKIPLQVKNNMQVCVVGLGKVGLPLAAVMADAGIHVIGIDTNPILVNQINTKQNPIPQEPGLQELLNKHVPSNFTATTSFIEAAKNTSAFIVIVPLFIDENKNPDFSVLESAFKRVGKVLKKEDLVILETTVPPKTTQTIIKKILEENSGLQAGTDFYLAYSPERIMTGYSISRYKEYPKVIGGINDLSTKKAYDLYSRFCSKISPVKDIKTAEFIKVAEGIYRDVNIALANELYKISQELDIDFWEMREKAAHSFCNIHEAGIGVSGHCIPVYPWFLINNYNVPLIKKAREINDSMVDYFVERIKKRNAKKVLVVGLAYRENVKETIYARSRVLIEKLKQNGFEVFGLDPLYNEEETKKTFNIQRIDDFNSVDSIIVVNNNTEYFPELKKYKDKIIGVKNII